MEMQIPGNIFLVGLMGAGKTTVGKLLARRLHKTFLDADHEIERRTGARVPLIFELEGEAGFRRREARLLKELVLKQNIVLATGGGVILSPENRHFLSEHGTVVYLNAEVGELWQRTRHDKNRPLLRTANPRAKLEELYRERDPLYREIADVIIDSSAANVHALLQDLEQKLLHRIASSC